MRISTSAALSNLYPWKPQVDIAHVSISADLLHFESWSVAHLWLRQSFSWPDHIAFAEFMTKNVSAFPTERRKKLALISWFWVTKEEGEKKKRLKSTGCEMSIEEFTL